MQLLRERGREQRVAWREGKTVREVAAAGVAVSRYSDRMSWRGSLPLRRRLLVSFEVGRPAVVDGHRRGLTLREEVWQEESRLG